MSLSLEIEAWCAGPGSPWRNVLTSICLLVNGQLVETAGGGSTWKEPQRLSSPI